MTDSLMRSMSSLCNKQSTGVVKKIDSLMHALKYLEVGFVLLVHDLHLLGVQHSELHHLLHRERRLPL